jgi:hypothetical protein
LPPHSVSTQPKKRIHTSKNGYALQVRATEVASQQEVYSLAVGGTIIATCRKVNGS